MSPQPPRLSREKAVALVQLLLDGDVRDEDEASQVLHTLERGLVCPHISDYIFYDFDPELTAEKVVDRALAYRPIAR